MYKRNVNYYRLIKIAILLVFFEKSLKYLFLTLSETKFNLLLFSMWIIEKKWIKKHAITHQFESNLFCIFLCDLEQSVTPIRLLI